MTAFVVEDNLSDVDGVTFRVIGNEQYRVDYVVEIPANIVMGSE
jgi:hypothetical protein